ncbi:MAG TPA: hypothetical protein VIN08_23705 [Ohtaekwangia sp.]|uniref:hypothetical protein n=1 Tax=Ohtaekwangia sp. TaxID=2066019 RepID=UPI002F927A3B
MKTILLVLFTACSFACVAQFNRNTIVASGFGTYGYKENSNHRDAFKNSTYNLTLNPSVGFFVIDKLMVGAELGWISSKDKVNSATYASLDKARSFSAGPVVRYYIVKGFFVQGGYFWGKMKQQQSLATMDIINGLPGTGTYQTSYSEVKQNLQGYTITPGISLFLDQHKKAAVDVMAGYYFQRAENINYKGLVVGLGVSIFLFKNP